MARIRVETLSKRFEGKPPTVAADGLNLEIEDGEFLVLLGPSGCGKTTTLRCLAGLESPDSGRIAFGDATMFDSSLRLDVPPERRRIGMVFQSYALWPHMTVRANIEYPLRARGIREGLRDNWAEETARLLDCQALLDRYPSQLSGGQQQRVALARGLVARPELVLFDEPLSNLDARLRDQVRAQLHELHSRLKFTAVFVTHDQSEALALGDRLAIMRAGRIEQLDTPQRVFARPATEYVAGFIGMSNRFELTATDGRWFLGQVLVGGALDALPPGMPGLVARVRSDDLVVSAPGDAGAPGTLRIPANVIDATFAGRHYDVVVSVGGVRMQGRTTGLGGMAPPAAGDPVHVVADLATLVFFDADGRPVDLPRGRRT